MENLESFPLFNLKCGIKGVNVNTETLVAETMQMAMHLKRAILWYESLQYMLMLMVGC